MPKWRGLPSKTVLPFKAPRVPMKGKVIIRVIGRAVIYRIKKKKKKNHWQEKLDSTLKGGSARRKKKKSKEIKTKPAIM